MYRHSISSLSKYLITYGRVFRDPEEDILFFNWSCSTVEILFSGTHLFPKLQTNWCVFLTPT